MAYVAGGYDGRSDELFWDFVEEYIISMDSVNYHDIEDYVCELWSHPATIWNDYRRHRMSDEYRNPIWFGPGHFRYGLNILTPEEHYHQMFSA